MAEWLYDSMPAPGTGDRRRRASGAKSTYAELVQRAEAGGRQRSGDVEPGAVVAFDGDYGPGSISLLLALALNRTSWCRSRATSRRTTRPSWHCPRPNTGSRRSTLEPKVTGTGNRASTAVPEVRTRANPGPDPVLVGSTGAHKCALHDFSLLSEIRSAAPRLSHAGVPAARSHRRRQHAVLHARERRHGRRVPPTDRRGSLPGDCDASARAAADLADLPEPAAAVGGAPRHDLSSLELITYGTEPMPETTLERVSEAFPEVRLLQTYGLSELGILRSQSRSSDSLWVRVGGEGFETKVVDGRLWIRAESAMLGYLNAPSPFDADGFFDTGDLVEVDGEWIRILGRQSDIINVGGSKVFPAEVESVLLEMPNVADAAVVGERSPITGQIVAATVRLIEPEPADAFKTRMRVFCADRLSSFKIPARVRLTEQSLHSERFKRRRLAS